MVMTFSYKTIDRKEQGIEKAPVIPVTIIGNNESVDTMGLLDSGADFSAMPKELAEILGVDLNGKKEDIGGISGSVEAVEKHINISIKKGHENYYLHIPVKIILSNTNIPFILWRNGFFNEFLITFDESSLKISLKKIESNNY